MAAAGGLPSIAASLHQTPVAIMSQFRSLAATLALAGAFTQAQAFALPPGDSFDIIAKEHSSADSQGLATIVLQAGQTFTITADSDDLWSAGPLPRWSNADGLVGNLLATGTDESGAAAGTLIGQNWGSYGAFAYGTLVGRIGNGSFFSVGTNYQGVASQTGMLSLFYWDSNSGDNSGYITAHINAVPEPASVALLLGGLAVVGFAARRRKA
jgi:hypothetical protein